VGFVEFWFVIVGAVLTVVETVVPVEAPVVDATEVLFAVLIAVVTEAGAVVLAIAVIAVACEGDAVVAALVIAAAWLAAPVEAEEALEAVTAA